MAGGRVMKLWYIPLLLVFALSPEILLLSGCAVQNPITIERPNARTVLEERAYNLLLVSETLITRAELSNAQGTLPEFMKPILNRIIDLHNDTKKAADSYVALIEAGTEEEGYAALDALITNLSSAIDNLFTTGGQ